MIEATTCIARHHLVRQETNSLAAFGYSTWTDGSILPCINTASQFLGIFLRNMLDSCFFFFVYVLQEVHSCEPPTLVISDFCNMPMRDPFAGILLSLNSMILLSVDVTDFYLPRARF